MSLHFGQLLETFSANLAAKQLEKGEKLCAKLERIDGGEEGEEFSREKFSKMSARRARGEGAPEVTPGEESAREEEEKEVGGAKVGELRVQESRARRRATCCCVSSSACQSQVDVESVCRAPRTIRLRKHSEPAAPMVGPQAQLHCDGPLRAQLRTVYEPRHYLANCAPIQFVVPAAQKQQVARTLDSGAATARPSSPPEVAPSTGQRASESKRQPLSQTKIKRTSFENEENNKSHQFHAHIIPRQFPGLLASSATGRASSATALAQQQQQQVGAAPPAKNANLLLSVRPARAMASSLQQAAPVAQRRRYSTSVAQQQLRLQQLAGGQPLALGQRQRGPRGSARRLSVLPSGAPARRGSTAGRLQPPQQQPSGARQLLPLAPSLSLASAASPECACNAESRRHTLATDRLAELTEVW